jgi:chitin synthase
VAHDPVRRVSKHQRRSSSRQYLSSPISSSSTHHPGSLPPGAVSRDTRFMQ